MASRDHSMARRGFLRQLTSLPLIGGTIALTGTPSAVAAPIGVTLLETYKSWLDGESRWLAAEMATMPDVRAIYHFHAPTDTPAALAQRIRGNVWPGRIDYRPHFDPGPHDAPSSRAALVLSAAGCGFNLGA